MPQLIEHCVVDPRTEVARSELRVKDPLAHTPSDDHAWTEVDWGFFVRASIEKWCRYEQLVARTIQALFERPSGVKIQEQTISSK
jgi:hypothetical protein